jgi:hypothetical protein
MMVGTLRVGGEDLGSERFTAAAAGERIELIDRHLRDASRDPVGDVLYLEIDRADDGFATLDRYRTVVDGTPVETPELIEFMRVGVAGQFGAAEHVRFRPGSGEDTVRVTHNPRPGPGRPQVLSDTHVPSYFPAEAVLDLAAIRKLMIDFATTGEWSHATLWRTTST